MPSALQRPHILIVSNDEDLIAFLSEGLIYAGFWTSVIASAMQALEVFRLRSFDALLLDAGLGGIGSINLLERLRGQSNRAAGEQRTDIPIVVIAASPGEIDPEFARRLDVSRVVIAPLELADLASLLFSDIAHWRDERPERPWADVAHFDAP